MGFDILFCPNLISYSLCLPKDMIFKAANGNYKEIFNAGGVDFTSCFDHLILMGC
jgi:hypothetical protein